MTAWIGDFHFLRPLWFLTIPVAAAVWWIWKTRTEPLRGWRNQMAPEFLQVLATRSASGSRPSSLWLLVAWLLTIIALAGPTWRLEPSPFAEDARPLMILLKADESMALTDVSPSRLGRAQLELADLAADRPGQPLGLIVYAGSAHLVLPPTRDAKVVADMAAEISPEIMPAKGDRLDLAVREAHQWLANEGGGTLLVVADSSSTDVETVSQAVQASGSPPIQFLAFTSEGSPELASLRDVAARLNATVQMVTPDDEDTRSIIRFAERRAAAGVAGEGDRWQEAGYWLTPLIAVFVVLSFRRTVLTQVKEPS